MGSEARARVGLWLLIAATLFSFGQVFGSDDYVGPALLGAAAATLLCMGARRVGLGTFFATLISTAGLAIYLTLVFAMRTTLYGLPTLRTALTVWDAVLDAYHQSSIDFSPVPTRTGYAILMVGAFWIVATIGETATFRWRLPLVASLGPIGLFCLSLVVGTGVGSPVLVAMFLAALLTYWALESSHRLRTWGRWVTPWSHQTNVQPESVTGGLARRMGYSCVAAALVAPFFLPAIGNGLLSWRSGNGPGGGGPGSGGSGIVNPWVRLTPQEIGQSSNELLRVSSERETYWRLVSLNHFENGTWTSEALETTPLSGQTVIAGAQGLGGRALIQDVTIVDLRGQSLPAATQATRITFAGDTTAPEVLSDETGSLRAPDGLTTGVRYQVESLLPEYTADELRNASIGNPGESYFETPAISDEVVSLTDKWTSKATTPFERLIAIQEHLRRFQYDLDVPPPSSDDYLTEFLFDDKAGFCQQFATAFALQARLLGYPSRVSVGFLPGTSTEAAPGEFSVHGTDAHAWPEVYFDEFGWVRFEPTPRGPEVVPRYTQVPADTNAGPGANGTGNQAGGKAGVNAGKLDQFATRGRGNGGGQGPIDPRTGPTSATPNAPDNTQWQKTFAAILRVGALLLVLFLASVPLLKELRTRRRYRNATDPRAVTGAAFLQFEEEAAGLASPRRPSETAQTFAERLAERGKVTDRSANRLAALYEAAVFSPQAIEPYEGVEARELAGSLRHELWARASWWTRAMRLFSPKGLRVGG
jgi:hypothetical protein